MVIAAAAYLVFHVVLYHTRFGTYVFAIGGHRESLTLAGVRTNLYHVGIYALGGVMAGVGALILTGRMNAGHPIASIGMEFDAIAAVVVGGTSFERGNGWLPGTLLGVLTIGVLKNGLNAGGAFVAAERQHRAARHRRAAGRFDSRARVIALGARLAGVVLLGLALAVFSDAFLTANNLLNVLRQASLTFLVGSGVTLVILAAGLDLSIGANVGLSACVAAAVMKSTGTIALGVAAGLACGRRSGS